MTDAFTDTRLRGLELRYVLIDVLLGQDRSLGIQELVRHLELAGFELPASRPGKAISDALRWEVRRGRVRRVGPGRYAVGTMPRSTNYWIRKRAAVARARAGGSADPDRVAS